MSPPCCPVFPLRRSKLEGKHGMESMVVWRSWMWQKQKREMEEDGLVWIVGFGVGRGMEEERVHKEEWFPEGGGRVLVSREICGVGLYEREEGEEEE